jgi:hypothetical protein
MKNSATRTCLGCGGSGLGVSEHDRACDLPGCASAVRCPACLGTGRVTDGPFRRDAEVDAESLRLARQDCLADYQTGRVDALDFVRAGNMLAEAK